MSGRRSLPGAAGCQQPQLAPAGAPGARQPTATCLPFSPGLDTFKAFKVAKILANLAHNYGRTVCATIHQPSSEIWQCFDDLVLLADGNVRCRAACWPAAGLLLGLGGLGSAGCCLT